MPNTCPVCAHRVSNWHMATGKAITINELLYHISCIGDITIKELSEIQLLEVIRGKKAAS